MKDLQQIWTLVSIQQGSRLSSYATIYDVGSWKNFTTSWGSHHKKPTGRPSHSVCVFPCIHCDRSAEGTIGSGHLQSMIRTSELANWIFSMLVASDNGGEFVIVSIAG